MDVDGFDRVLQVSISSSETAGSTCLSGWPPRCSRTMPISSSAPGIAERGLQEEAVELRFGERERAFELDRVLRREDEERLRQDSREAVDGDLPFGHRLE